MVGIISYVPDPSLNLPALMIQRSQIQSRMHIPHDSCIYYDTDLHAWKGVVDPADVEPACLEPEDFITGTSNSKKEVGDWETDESNDDADEKDISCSSTKQVEVPQPKSWCDFFRFWTWCSPQHDKKE